MAYVFAAWTDDGKVHVVLSSPARDVATDSRAAAKGGGKSFPRRSARRSIPVAALGLKKYLGGSGPVSKTSDNEHTAAALGHSEVLSVKHPVGPPIPEFCQPSKDDGHVSAAVAGEKAGDVLDDHPTGSELSKETMELEPKSAPLASQASTLSSHAEVLAGESSADHIDIWEEVGGATSGDASPAAMASVGMLWSSVGVRSVQRLSPFAPVWLFRTVYVTDVGAVLGVGEAAGEDSSAGVVELDLPERPGAGSPEPFVKSSDAGEERANS
jgi:hypothetical protein